MFVHGEKQKLFHNTFYAFAIPESLLLKLVKPDTQVFYALIYNYVMPYYGTRNMVWWKMALALTGKLF